VRAKNAVATDLGTEFVMRAYASDSAVSVAVTSGIVSLSGAVPAQSVKLVAGDVGRVDRSGQPRRDAIASAATSNAWLAGRLIFENQPLTQVVAELNRWFDVDIRVPDGPLSARRVTALYSTPTLAGVLDALTSMLGARYEQQGRVITLHPVSR
ncbi:MAG: FecR domain-containing protein, partial [bacterium]